MISGPHTIEKYNSLNYSDSSHIFDLEIKDESILLINLKKPMTTLGNSVLNGGFAESVETLFNVNIPENVETEKDLPGESLLGFTKHICNSQLKDVSKTTGLMTVALMKNAAVSQLKFNDISVSCIATAGVDTNGGRAGDKASYYEKDGEFFQTGTINIFLIIDAPLTKYAMVKSIITSTEAKTSVLQELLAPSKYSEGLATGSGTDGIIVASIPESKELKEKCLTDAGHHSKLGEMISRTVRKSVKYALFLETGLSPKRKKNIWARLLRYNILPENVYIKEKKNEKKGSYNKEKSKIEKSKPKTLLEKLETDGTFVAFIETILHLKDQVSWGLLEEDEALKSISVYLNGNFCEIPAEFFSEISFGDDFSEKTEEFLRKIHSVELKTGVFSR